MVLSRRDAGRRQRELHVKPPKSSASRTNDPRGAALASRPGISVDQLLAALSRKGIPLPFELGTFLVLQATEQALVLEATEQGMPAPPHVGIADVWVSDDGEIGVLSDRPAESDQAACRALVVMLGEMLVRSAPGVPPMLLELVEHGPSDGEWSLMRLRDDLEASLVPLNRGALKRVLARMLREVRRETERASAMTPDAGDLDRDVDALLGLESPPPPRPRTDSGTRPAATRAAEPARREPERREDDVSRDRDELEEPDEGEEAPTLRRPGLSTDDLDEVLADRPRRPAKQKRARDAEESLDAFEQEGEARRGSPAWLGIGLAIVAAALVAGYLYAGRDRARNALGLPPEPTAEPPPPPAPAAPARKYGELRVTSTPARAQVLLFVGKGPVVVPDLPIGTAHEFVAFDGQLSPARAVVAKDAAFQSEGGGKPRYELALQLDEADPKRRSEELGPTRLTQDVGTPNGTVGEVRVITSPPGVRVYQLIGFTPDARVQNVAIDEPLEVLVYLPGYALARVDVRPDTWKEQASALVADLQVTLTRSRAARD